MCQLIWEEKKGPRKKGEKYYRFLSNHVWGLCLLLETIQVCWCWLFGDSKNNDLLFKAEVSTRCIHIY